MVWEREIQTLSEATEKHEPEQSVTTYEAKSVEVSIQERRWVTHE
jgi:hypothetical protein